MMQRFITKYRCIAALLMLFGVIGVISTYTRLNWTNDEEYHIACGMEWWKNGTYSVQPLHPPLARVMDAALLYWLEGDYPPDPSGQTRESMRGVYKHYLVLSRLGTLPFYILSCLLVFLWSRNVFGPVAALWSLGLYVTLSTVTAHGALATTDMGYTAMFLWAMMASISWLKTPTFKQSLWMGLSIGLMVGTKFSALAQYPAAMAMVLLAQAIANYKQKQSIFLIKRAHIKSLIYIVPVLIYTIAMVYRFSLDYFFKGIRDAFNLNQHGYGVWFYGPLNNHGVWAFFPVVFLFKTPLPFFATILWGHVRIVREWDYGRIERLFPLLAAIGILLASITSHINLGVRHVLPMYALLAIPAGYGLMQLWRGGLWKRTVAAGLLGWQLLSFVNAYPEHIAYFNELAGEHPERITLDSDFDWGQGLYILDTELQRRGINEVYYCARRNTAWIALLLVHAKTLPCPTEPVSGWVVVSRANRLLYPNNFTWLNGHEAVQSIGKTLDLYYIPAE